MDNKFGKVSQINISTRLKDGEAILDDVYFTAPFKIMSPFYINKTSMQVMMMTASAGIMEGDVQDFSFHIGSGTRLELCSQSFEKIHKMKDGEAHRNTVIRVEKDACLYYNPMPTIPFKDSAYRSNMEIHLASDRSEFVMCEILSSGRTASGESFAYRYYHSLVQVYKEGRLTYRDNTYNDPALFDMSGICMYEGYTHLANLLLCNRKHDTMWQKKVRELIESKEAAAGGITMLTDGDIIVRILGNQAQKLSDLCKEIVSIEI